MNIPSKCRTASIGPNHAMILPHDANPKPNGIFGKDSWSARMTEANSTQQTDGLPRRLTSALELTGVPKARIVNIPARQASNGLGSCWIHLP
jgi:hypothetical protein